MPITTQVKEINGHRYEVQTFGGVRGNNFFGQLRRWFAEPLAGTLSLLEGVKDLKALKSGDSDSIDLSNAARTFQDIIGKLSDNIGAEEFTNFLTGANPNGCVGGFFEFVRRDGKPINFEIDFAGEIFEIYEVFAFVASVNYKDFSERLKKKISVGVKTFLQAMTQTQTQQ